MNKYELVVLVKSQITNDEKEGIFKVATEAVTKSGGKVINAQVWLEKQKLAFDIKKCWEATYYLVKFESLTKAIEKIRQTVRLNEDVLRFAIIKVD